jgi:hypothetical protein
MEGKVLGQVYECALSSFSSVIAFLIKALFCIP